MQNNFIDVVFDGPPGPVAGRFVEVENVDGKSINAGEWIDRGNGLWALRIGVHADPKLIAAAPEMLELLREVAENTASLEMRSKVYAMIDKATR